MDGIHAGKSPATQNHEIWTKKDLGPMDAFTVKQLAGMMLTISPLPTAWGRLEVYHGHVPPNERPKHIPIRCQK